MLSKVVSSTIFKVFGMTRPGIEPRSPGPLANTLTAGPMSRSNLWNKRSIFTMYHKWINPLSFDKYLYKFLSQEFKKFYQKEKKNNLYDVCILHISHAKCPTVFSSAKKYLDPSYFILVQWRGALKGTGSQSAN